MVRVVGVRSPLDGAIECSSVEEEAALSADMLLERICRRALVYYVGRVPRCLEHDVNEERAGALLATRYGRRGSLGAGESYGRTDNRTIPGTNYWIAVFFLF